MSNFKTSVYKNLKGLRHHFPLIEKPVLQTIIQICVISIENGKLSPEIFPKALKKLNNSNEFNSRNFMEQFTAIFIVIEMYLKQIKKNSNADELKEVLTELRLPADSIQSLCKILLTHQHSLALNYYETKSLQIAPKTFEYRLNITLMDNAIISRISQPNVVLQIHKNNGETISMEISIAMFHKIRYNLALLLKEMQLLRKRQIMKK